MKLLQRIYALTAMLCLASLTYPLDGVSFETSTHRLINESAASQLEVKFFDQPISFDDFLRFQIGLAQGIDTVVNGQSILEWIRIGGAAEDQFLDNEILGGLTRSPRHFHTPLRTWDQSGLDLFVTQFQSSVRWAQNPSQSPGGRASWKDARDTYFRALTGSTKSERDKAFAETFQILGQLMHLVADLASPPHTRNDPHPFSYSIESFMGKEENQVLITGFEKVDPAILQQSTGDPIAKVPVARLWDTDTYSGGNPGVTTGSTADGATIGLAEFTSANFFSNDTISRTTSDDPDLPFPAIDRLSPGPVDFYPPTGKLRQYLSKLGDGIAPIDHMVAEGIFVQFTPPFFSRYVLDDLVYADYAQHLLPRAIGYSAGLIDYFFRGGIDVLIHTPFLSGTQLSGIIFGTLPANEASGTGILILVLGYQPINSNEILYFASAPLSMTLVPDQEQDVTFDFSDDPIPPDIVNGTFQGRLVHANVVYKGRFGMEDGAVIASFPGLCCN